MKNLLTTTAVLALLAGTVAAFAQPAETTTTQSPDSTTQTTVTKSSDGDYTEYRKTVTSTRHFHAGEWAAPTGFTVRHYSLGDRLPRDLLVNHYELTDYGTYELVAPPSGTVWVRVKSDAFLVRTDDGEIIQADYGMFN
ncbi:MAG TPA: RcnB family protein [Rhizomicrobium sp.]|nr:RcnB family protein [Rhizomicrobium sp.]